MKKKTIEVEINVPEPGDSLPFVVWQGDFTICYSQDGNLSIIDKHGRWSNSSYTAYIAELLGIEEGVDVKSEVIK